MAKSSKKSLTKASKKTIAKVKPADKTKKPVAAKPKAKVVAKKKIAKAIVPKKKAVAKKKVEVAKKGASKKAEVKKVDPVKKITSKKIEVKAEPKKKVAVEKKVTPAPKKIAKEKLPKEQDEPLGLSTPASRKQEAMAIPKTSPQLTIFQIPTVRPIAHKSTVPSSNSQDKTRYSDEELKEFETLIKSKLEKANEEFKILKGTLNRTDDSGTDSTSGGNTKVLEDGAETAEKENLSQLAARQLKYITNLENALVRIKNRTYGICSVTGKLISKERLIAVPHTTQSIEAKMMNRD